MTIRVRVAVWPGQFIDVNGSPVSSSFGHYIGGQKGTIFATGVSVLFLRGDVGFWHRLVHVESGE